MKLAPNFDLSEFRCHDGTEVPEEYTANVTKLAQQLQVLHDYLDSKVIIRSGYRTPAYNKRVGGAKQSQHMLACAADIIVPGTTPLTVWRTLSGLMRCGAIINGGLGRYKSFNHYDIGPMRRWEGK
jgi:uncharacterized protein YcbK (DUF882 family)